MQLGHHFTIVGGLLFGVPRQSLDVALQHTLQQAGPQSELCRQGFSTLLGVPQQGHTLHS